MTGGDGGGGGGGPINHDQFVALLRQERATAILRTADPEQVEPAMQAAVDGGFKVIEFTLNTPGALTAIRRFVDLPGVALVGAGTVLTPDDARAAADAGAGFLVSPVVDEAVIDTAHELGLPMVPGCRTPTEFLRAHRAGAPVQKLFPGVGAGPEFIRSLLGPLPFLNVLPTSGVTADNARAHIQAGALAVGFVRSLFDCSADELPYRVRQCLAAVKSG